MALATNAGRGMDERASATLAQPLGDRDDRVEAGNAAGASAEPSARRVHGRSATVALETLDELLAGSESERVAHDQVLVRIRRVDLDRVELGRVPAGDRQCLLGGRAGLWRGVKLGRWLQ